MIRTWDREARSATPFRPCAKMTETDESMRYDKLVRDRIPELIREKNQSCSFHVATDEEYRKKLYEKLHEEAEELVADRNAGEVADILEVLDAIMALEGISPEEVSVVKQEKHERRGGFESRIILEES